MFDSKEVRCMLLAIAFLTTSVFFASPSIAITLFQDDFEGDTVGSGPLIDGADVGANWDLFIPDAFPAEARAQVHQEGEIVSSPGDYNDDKTVNLADYTVWRDNLSSEESLPNDLIGGMIGLDQYGKWKENFGEVGFASPPASANGGDKYLLLNRIFSGSPIATGHFDGPELTTGEVTVEFDAYLQHHESQDGRGQVFFTDGTNQGAFDRLANLFFADGAVLEFDGSALVPIAGLTYAAEQWQHVEITLDLDNDTYFVDIENGTSTGGGTFLGDAVSAGRGLAAVNFSAVSSNSGIFYIDNALVEGPGAGSLQAIANVPEPSGMVTLAIAALVATAIKFKPRCTASEG